MSLILDSLEQAERDRQGQPVQQRLVLGTAASDPPGARPGSLGWPIWPIWPIWLVGGAALALAAVLAWERWGGEAPAGPTQQPAARAAAPLPSTTLTPALPAGTALFTPAPVAASAAPTLPVTTMSETTTSRPALPALAATGPTAADVAPPPASPPVPASAPVPTASELPAPARARLPSLAISGHTYSDNPTLRTLMIDGRMLVEGQTLSPGLRLERIERHQAVFSLDGNRFAVGY